MRSLNEDGFATTRYEAVKKLLVTGGHVLLDGPAEADLSRHRAAPGFDALVEAHRAHIEAGCDVIRTCTATLPHLGAGGDEAPRWLDLARERIDAARAAAAGTPAAVAYTIGRHAAGPEADELVPALERLFRKAQPDLVLVESLTVIQPSLYTAAARLLALGLPVWLSFRRCRDGLCGPSGHHWGSGEPDRFGGAAARLERMGVSALLVNCVPPQHVAGTFEYLRYFTDLPLGVYANLEPGFGPETLTEQPQPGYEQFAGRWRAEGAQIIGGCCGVGPALIAATRDRLDCGVIPDADADVDVAPDVGPDAAEAEDDAPVSYRPGSSRRRGGGRQAGARPWTSTRGRVLYPLPFPRLAPRRAGADAGPAPTGCDLLLWEYLYKEGSGANQRCLDVGSGSGLLAAQLALNGATHVHSIDSDPGAVQCTLDSAFRNDVSSLVTAEEADLTRWRPLERYEVVVASLEQQGTDPDGQDYGEREFDPWGRRLIDAFLAKLPELLAREGVAYLAHSSAISQRRTAEMLTAAGLTAEVVDWRVWPTAAPMTGPGTGAGLGTGPGTGAGLGTGPGLGTARSHRARIEQASDAFHLDAGTGREEDELTVLYVLEIRPPGSAATRPPGVPGLGSGGPGLGSRL